MIRLLPFSALLFLLLMGPGLCRLQAQDTIYLHYPPGFKVNSRSSPPKPIIVQGDPATHLKNVIDTLVQQGYFSLGIDSVRQYSKRSDYFLNPGTRFTLGSPVPGLSHGLDALEIYAALRDTVSSLCNMGFPFASASTRAELIAGDSIIMMTIIEPGQRYRIGEIRVSGPVQPGPAYLLAISEIEPGELYSEDAINSLENRLTIDGIYRLSARPALEFADSVCNIGLTLQLRRKPSVSGLIGLSPIPGSGKAGLSGDLRAFLPGLMNHGDLLDLRWTSPAAGSQELDVSLYYPYVAGFQWALRSSLKLKKIDTLYFNNDFLLGAIYLGNEKLRSGISWRYWSGAELNSGNMASRRQLLGFTLASGTYDESANPESGTRLSFSAETGYLSRQKGELNSEARLRLQSQFGLSQYIPVKGRLILHYHLNAALLAGDSLRTAEMYRIGGNRMLRGFDEEQFITSAYAITSCGLRYRADNITFAGLFLDLAVMNPESPGDLRIAYAPGIEAGIGSSNFMIILRYALGTEWSESIELSRGRLHIGLLLGVE